MSGKWEKAVLSNKEFLENCYRLSLEIFVGCQGKLWDAVVGSGED